jgi:hypothetical protein
MATEYDRLSDEPRRSSPFLRALIIAGVGFAGGLVAMGYLLTHWDTAVAYLKGQKPAQPAPVAMMKAPATAAMTPRTVDSDILSMRIGAIEARLDTIEERANAASGNANRAEGLLVAFAARRALDRGTQLGYIESLLRERFGATQPQAVATIISAARQPVTLEELRAGLEQAGPALAGPGKDEGWWEGFRRELAGLVVVRHSNTPSPAASDRLARAKALIAAGQVDEALAEVARLPGRDAAALWIAGARRYVLARGALDRIETAALLQPQAAPTPGASISPAP